MVRCMISRASNTARWLTAAYRRQTTSSSTPGDIVQQIDYSKIGQHAFKPVIQQDVDDNAGRRRASRDSTTRSKMAQPHIQPYKQRYQTISPFMDKAVLSARERYHVPKGRPSKTPTTYQQQLANNPYALALATPVRICQTTKTVLPNYFLQDFGLMAHPMTGEPWWVPTSLRTMHELIEYAKPSVDDMEPGASQSSAEDEASRPLLDNKSDPEWNTNVLNYTSILKPDQPPHSHTSLKLKRPEHPIQTPKLGPNMYTLSRRSLLRGLQIRKLGYGRRPWEHFGSARMRSSRPALKVLHNASWRIDMDSFILELMRRRVVEGLAYLVRRKRGAIAGCMDWEDAKVAHRQPGTILWTGEIKPTLDGGGQEELAEDRCEVQVPHGPPEFATLVVGTGKAHKIPVHNLRMLLGREHLGELRQKCAIFDKQVLIVRNKRNTIDVQMRLWKLQGYLAEFKQGFDADCTTTK